MRKTAHILLPVIFLLVILLCALFAGAQLLPQSQPVLSEAVFAQKGRALYLSTGSGEDFPSAPGLKKKELQAELDSLLEYAAQNGFGSVYYRATDGQTAFYHSKILQSNAAWLAKKPLLFWFDPLDYLCRQAAERGLAVYALTDTTTTDVCAELAGYDLAGVVLDSQSRSPYPEEFYAQAAAALADAAPRCSLGLVFEDGSVAPTLVESLASDGTLALVQPVLKAANTQDYDAALTRWGSLLANSPAKLVLWQPLQNLQSTAAQQELSCRLLLASMNGQVSGAVFGDAAALQAQPQAAQAVISCLADGGTTPAFDLDFSQELAICAPADESIRLDNSYKTYFISGTSDPEQPLFLDGEEVERISTNGVWGAQVELWLGKNVFTVTQGDQTASVTITVYNPNNITPSPISQITEGSRFPAADRVFRTGEKLEFSCVAPSGARVTAQIGGKTIPMTQKAATARPGIAATFGGSFEWPAVEEDEVLDLGSVTYTLVWNGTTTTCESAGNLFVAGQKADIVVQVDEYMIGLYTGPTGDGNVAANLNPGTRICLQGESEGSRELLAGLELYVERGGFSILEGSQQAALEYELPTLRTAQKGEELVLGQGLNTYLPTLEEDKLTITLLDTTFAGAGSGLCLTEGENAPQSQLFEAITLRNNSNGSAEIILTLRQGVALAGWDVYVDQNGQAVLYCQQLAALAQSYVRPLEGITIMVDPGHGGSDVGAAGAAGTGGPTEAEVNLTLSQLLRYRLQQLGATVVMTQDDNSRITIYERYLLAQRQRPDLFISVHHNSLAVTRNANEIYYTTGYYFYPQSQFLAETAAQLVHSRTGRDLIESSQAAYYVTRMSAAPSILFETGFVSNPREQQECCNRYTMCQTACALADAIVQSFAQPTQ